MSRAEREEWAREYYMEASEVPGAAEQKGVAVQGAWPAFGVRFAARAPRRKFYITDFHLPRSSHATQVVITLASTRVQEVLDFFFWLHFFIKTYCWLEGGLRSSPTIHRRVHRRSRSVDRRTSGGIIPRHEQTHPWSSGPGRLLLVWTRVALPRGAPLLFSRAPASFVCTLSGKPSVSLTGRRTRAPPR